MQLMVSVHCCAFRKRGENTDQDFIGAAAVSLPLIYSSLQDIEKGAYPQGFFLNVDIPYRPLQHKVVHKASPCIHRVSVTIWVLK